MEKQIRLFLEGGTKTIDIFDFEYNARRMGSAPTITATINSFRMLDIDTTCWCQFVANNGVLGDERFLVRNEPDKTKKSTDARYSYTVVFVSEREILDNVYFIDAAKSSVFEGQVVSKGVDFVFSGTVKDYVNKLNDSFNLSKLEGYSVVVDSSVESQDIAKVTKVFSLSKATYTSGLQEIYNQFDIPYYFDGKTVHVGYYNEGVPTASVKYGSDDALIQVSKTSKNNKIVTRCSGVGSSENLPPYYPNLSQTGEHSIESCTGNITKAKIKSVDYNKMSAITHLRDGAVLTFRTKSSIADKINKTTIEYLKSGDGWYNTTRRVIEGNFGSFTVQLYDDWDDDSQIKYQDWTCSVVFTFYAEKDITAYGVIETAFAEYVPVSTATNAQRISEKSVWITSMQCSGVTYAKEDYTFSGPSLTFVPKATGKHTFTVYYKLKLEAPLYEQNEEQTDSLFYSWCNCTASFNYATSIQVDDYVMVDDSDQTFEYSESGIVFVDNFKPSDKSTITVSETLNWLQPQPNLMPSIYRATSGVERFYNAVSGGYSYPEGASETDVQYVVNIDGSFENEYNPLRFCEHIEDFDDVRPTITGSVHPTTKLRMDMFSDFAYDSNDSDEFNEDEELKHKFFYAKLRQLDFNLFEHTLEDGEVTFSFTTGDCASCQFVMMVDDETKKNTLQVDASGNIVFNDDGTAKFDKNKPQATQNDTSKNAVWIALKKEDATFGELRPNKVYKPTPSTTTSNNGDTFVITNVRMPNTYILNAEKELEDRIITYMTQNNISGYNFDIKFSRIFLEQNKDTFTRLLNESSRLTLDFHGSEYQLYVNSFRYKTTHDAILPEISVTISDTLQLSKGGLSTLVSSVKSDVLAAVHNIDIMPTLARYAMRKDQDDSTPYAISAGSLTVHKTAEVKSSAFVKENLVVDGASKIGKGLTVGDFSNVMGSIRGGMISYDGDASFRSIRANYLEVMTLIYNQIKASSAYTVFDDTGTINELSVEDVDGEMVYTLSFEESELTVKNEQGLGIQQFCKDDIVHGYVNNLNNAEYSHAGECWMKIVEIPEQDNDLLDNQVKAILYDDSQTPSGVNIEPTINMTLAHRGNETDETRQTTFYISSRDGNIVQLLGVSSPKLYNINEGGSNYGVVIGKLPYDLLEYVRGGYPYVSQHDPVLYAKYVVVENLLQLDHVGQPIKTQVYRGAWSEQTADEEPYRVTPTTYDTVTHDGSWWECRVDKTTIEPKDNTTHWLKIVSKGNDSAIVSYDIQPSTNVIYFDTKTSELSVNNIEVKVGENTALGYRLIDDNDELNDKGLSMWYSIDGQEPLVEFNISDTSSFELEDGSGLLVSEQSLAFFLEGSLIEASSIKDNITLHLKNEEGTNLALFVIPFIKAGSFKSTVFTRDTTLFENNETYVPQGGTYNDPIPSDYYTNDEGTNVYVWSDDIPAGVGPIYSSFNTFYGDGTSDTWSKPSLMSDSSDFEVIYSQENFSSVSEARNAIPDGFSKVNIDIDAGWLLRANENGWYDEAEQIVSPVWMATNSRKQGYDWSDDAWVVTKIKGEGINKNLIINSNFENFVNGLPDKWSAYSSTTSPNVEVSGKKDGQNILKMHDDSGSLKSNLFSLEADSIYTFSIYVYALTTELKCISLIVPLGATFVTENATKIQESAGSKGKTVSFASNKSGEWVKIIIHVKTSDSGYDNCALIAGETGSEWLYCMPKMEIGDVATAYFPAVEDLVGPAGEAGPLLYSAGEWTGGKLYERTNNTVPLVYYDPNTSDNNEGLYYILQVDRVQSYKSPANDTTSWRSMTEYEALFVKFLMARWAKFGSDNGAIFYDKFLFSQKGKVNGSDETYNTHKNNMFDASGNFQDDSETAFVPNLYIDFLNGKIYAQDAVIKGQINATSGTMDSVTATNLTVNSGEFTGKVTANRGSIGGFSLNDGNLKAPTAKLSFGKSVGDGIYCEMHATSDQRITTGSNEYSFNKFRTVYNDANEMSGTQTVFADIVDNIILFYGNAITMSAYGTKYGYQYAMNGRGHLILDGMVDGTCYNEIKIPLDGGENLYNYSAYREINPALYGNRVFVKSMSNDRHAIVFPSKSTFKASLGYDVNGVGFKGVSLKISITNSSANTIDIIGKNDVYLGLSQPYYNNNYPTLFLKSGEASIHKGGCYLSGRTSKDFLLSLSEDESEYCVYELT